MRACFVLWELSSLAGSQCLSRRGNCDALGQEFRLREHAGSMPLHAWVYMTDVGKSDTLESWLKQLEKP